MLNKIINQNSPLIHLRQTSNVGNHLMVMHATHKNKFCATSGFLPPRQVLMYNVATHLAIAEESSFSRS